MTRHSLLLFAPLLLAACSPPTPGTLQVGEAVAYAPLTAGAPAVAYFTLRNTTARPISIHRFESRLFALAELHETVSEHGQSRMQKLSKLSIGAGEEFLLQPGGPHLMLMQARAPVAAGVRDTLTIHFDDQQAMTIELPLSNRLTTTTGQAPQ